MSNLPLTPPQLGERQAFPAAEPNVSVLRAANSTNGNAQHLQALANSDLLSGIRALYHQLDSFRSQDGRSLRAIGVTSCLTGEGTTTVASNLASIAAQGRRVLLIDANKPRHELQTAMQAAVSNGIAARIEKTPGGLWQLDASKLKDGAGQSSMATTRELVGSLSSKFDLVVVDLPSLESADVLDWLSALDGVVLVIESERVRWQVAARSIELLEQAGGQVLGTVLNKQREYIPQWLYQRL